MNHDEKKSVRIAAEQLDHKAVTEMIPRYLKDELKDRELVRFLAHVRSCHTCYEELETAFMVDRTVRYLDEDLNDDVEGSYDLPELMEQDIRKKMMDVSRRRMLRRFFKVLLFAGVVFFVLMLLDFFGLIHVTRLL